VNVIALVPDAFGGRGGIALYNRHFLRAVCSFPGVTAVVAAPRGVYYELEKMPPNLSYLTWAQGALPRFALATAMLFARRRRAELIVCGHLHLLPFARALQIRHRCPMLPIVYGVESWRPTPHRSVNLLCRGLEGFVAISRSSAERLIAWSKMRNRCYHYLPNCVDETRYGVAPRRHDLIQRYGLAGRKVVMTAGRLDVGPRELRKGFEEVLGALPALARHVPNVTYLIMGDGEDRPRLEDKARALGVAERVVFTGYVPEAEKADHIRLADVFAMPGSNPLFDSYPFRFAFLEALVCGVPVVGACFETEAEADDPDARDLVIQVNPLDSEAIVNGILAAFSRSGQGIHPTLNKLYYRTFERRLHSILTETLARH
jgi:glycosyltransferase involved in cell wall biosynthesis